MVPGTDRCRVVPSVFCRAQGSWSYKVITGVRAMASGCVEASP